MTTQEAIEKSIKHWEENLELAENELLTADDIGSDRCALCQKYEDNCFRMYSDEFCPLYGAYGRCGTGDRHPWDEVFDSLRDCSRALVSDVENMLTCLRRLL